MLVEFNIENYRSFREDASFSLVAAKISSKNKNLDQENVFRADSKLDLLKSAVIYGANASGKSNLLAALRFMRWFVLNSSKETQVTEAIDVEPFRLSTETEGEPSLFEVVFIAKNRKYRYGFEANTEEVVSEWLFDVPTVKERLLFSRDKKIKISAAFQKSGGIKGPVLADITRPNALILSVSAQFNVKIAQDILSWFRTLEIPAENTLSNRNQTINYLENNQYKDEIINLIKKLDLGINDIQVETVEVDLPSFFPKSLSELNRKRLIASMTRKTITTSHWKYDKEGEKTEELFDIDANESEGTKKLFALAGPLINTLKEGKTLFVDEFDSSIHPLITCAIIGLFNSNETNSKNAQIVFITHDTNLLDNKIFRRDQIWFAEKDVGGGTHLYSLAEYKIPSEEAPKEEPVKKVRNDASFEDDYIRGKYGAIPFVGDLRRLLGEVNA